MTGIKILHKSRDGRCKKTGGGVAIAFNTGSCIHKIRHLKHIGKEYEVLCATGRVAKVERVVVVFVVYLPPSMKSGELEALREGLAVEVGLVRQTIKDPIVIVNGDFNQRDISEALKDVGEYQLLQSGPTRGQNCIDLIYTNAGVSFVAEETRTLPPLRSGTGVNSDHRCVYAEALFKPTRNYRWISTLRRIRDKDKDEAFAADMAGWDWAGFDGDVDKMAADLSEVIGTLTEKHFPVARVRKRSNESPWITRKIRKLRKRKIRLFKKGGRSDSWWQTDRVMQEKIIESRNSFVDRLLEGGSNGRSFYAATRMLATAAPPDRWTVCDLFPGKAPADVCTEVLDFYGAISSEGDPPAMRAPRVLGGLGPFTRERTTELLRAAKRSDSRVDGDPLAHLVRLYPEAFAIPVAAIYNKMNESGYWPAPWKTEHLTIIPKNPNPSGLTVTFFFTADPKN